MKKDIKKLSNFVQGVAEKNYKFGKETKVDLNYRFFGGKVKLIVDSGNMEFYDDYIMIDNDIDDGDDFTLTLEITDEVKIAINENAREFTITNVGVTGILDKRIEGKLVSEEE